MEHDSKAYFSELYKKNVNYYELVNIAAQAARLINEQSRLGIIQLKEKATTVALQKVLDGRIVKLESAES